MPRSRIGDGRQGRAYRGYRILRRIVWSADHHNEYGHTDKVLPEPEILIGGDEDVGPRGQLAVSYWVRDTVQYGAGLGGRPIAIVPDVKLEASGPVRERDLVRTVLRTLRPGQSPR